MERPGEQVYNWFNSLVALNGYFNWLTIYISHYRFRKGLKAQGIDYKSFKLYDKFFPYTTYVGSFIIFVLFIAQFYIGIYPLDDEGMSAAERTQNFFLTYLCVPLFVGCYTYYKLRWRGSYVKPEEMDFSAGKQWDKIEEIEEIKYEEKENSRKGVFNRFMERYFA
ncbi:unnamed protein product [Ambrosiozyma monospora]|uniref:Unnamed protein product n=1 Tax=Ambrosiozyma monospora TaxID=43982 RepID=A0A9W7DJJ0_AMBMO|nr:unnamed protein product [Ambrosiozyma monospora]